MTTENNIEQKLKKLSEFVNSTGSVKDSVMSRIKNEKPVIVCKPRFEYLRRIKMHKTIIKFATAAAVIAVVVLFSSQLFMVQKVSAAEIIYQAIEALENLKTVYIKAQMRTPRADNFSAISLMFDFVPVEMWKSMQDDGSFKWRIEKPLRVAANNSKKEIYSGNIFELFPFFILITLSITRYDGINSFSVLKSSATAIRSNKEFKAIL